MTMQPNTVNKWEQKLHDKMKRHIRWGYHSRVNWKPVLKILNAVKKENPKEFETLWQEGTKPNSHVVWVSVLTVWALFMFVTWVYFT